MSDGAQTYTNNNGKGYRHNQGDNDNRARRKRQLKIGATQPPKPQLKADRINVQTSINCCPVCKHKCTRKTRTHNVAPNM